MRKPSSSAKASAYVEATADKTEDKKEKASTADEVKITVDKAKSNVMKAEFVAGPTKGFMRADFTVAK